MTPEEQAKFAETAYSHGFDVAKSVWSIRSSSEWQHNTRLAWAEFYKTRAISRVLKQIANDQFWDGYDDAKRGLAL